MKFFPLSGLFAVLLLMCTTVQAQKTAIVLINEQPTRVVIKDGQITEIKNVVPGYMAGYEKAPADAFQKLPLESIEYLREADSLVIAAYRSPVTQAEADAVTGSINTTDSGKDLNSSINFDFESAILSEVSLETIEGYAEKLNNGAARSILLKSWYKDGDTRSEELVRNRLAACRQYLETKGVASNIILTSLVGSNRESRFVSVVLN